MSSRKQITGGTGDLNPQWLSETLIMSAANTFTQRGIVLPTSRFPLGKGKAMVMEVLQVNFFLGSKGNFQPATNQLSTTAAIVSTKALGSFAPDDPTVIATVDREYRTADGAEAFETVIDGPVQMNTNDGAGHGVLVATDTLFISQVTSNFGEPSACIFRLLYRWKIVALEEYIGIVQSQQ